MRLMIMSPDSGYADGLAKNLQSAGFGADVFTTLDDANEALTASNYSLVLLDSTSGDGVYSVWGQARCRCRRHDGDEFLVLIANCQDERIAALEAGADDSVTRDVSPRELVARVRTIMRRPRIRSAEQHQFSDLTLCTATREVRVGNLELTLQRRETLILESLMRRRGHVVPRAGLEHDVYGAQAEYCPNSLEVRVSRIRRQLAKARSLVTIESVRGVGYRLAARLDKDMGMAQSQELTA